MLLFFGVVFASYLLNFVLLYVNHTIMDETCSDSDVSLSPSQLLKRLQVLRQLQLLQRGKLQKQRLQYKETSETSSSITEIVSHFSNSTSYNTFRSLLQSSNDISNDGSPRLNTSDFSPKILERDLIDGVSVLNLSQESEFIVNSPVSSRSAVSVASKEIIKEHRSLASIKHSNGTKVDSSGSNNSNGELKKHISLDEMPILSPKQDFEALLLEKLRHEKDIPKSKSPRKQPSDISTKKPFLRRGEGMARFGIKKNNLVIQSTKALPWKRKNFQNRSVPSPKLTQNKKSNKQNAVEILVAEPQTLVTDIKTATLTRKSKSRLSEASENSKTDNTEGKITTESINSNDCELHSTTSMHKPTQKVNFQTNDDNLKHPNKPKHPLIANKGKTWAAVLTKEQDDFLRQLKQSEYYKNFTSPAKSIVSDISCDDPSNISQDKELAEQNMFELLENKVSHDSFNIESSFFNRFLRRSNLECSGESTPLVLQKCLVQNPDLMHIHTEMLGRARNESHSDVETCCSNCTDCCSDACSSVSCCSCKTVEPANNSKQNCNEYSESNKKDPNQKVKTKKVVQKEVEKSHDDTVTENDTMKENMAEMNAKLIATSDLLKDRLRELEDEIETFRKENASLAKLREDVDQERQKFYEEKAAFEQKFNEDKVLSEYYLAEEKEKLAKQKQMYERYVREMRGRLNKKDKDEVVNLKKEISDLKEEIRLKDAKSTSTIARLRNQIKLMEKEKKELNEEVEKLKKQNRRIQHSNEVTRRLTNIKYLAEINKKLSNMSSKETRSEVCSDRNIKYKAYEIERQNRSKKVEPVSKGTLRPRAKSVPNLNVTSRYAKYFSQRDTISHVEHNKLNLEGLDTSNDDNVEEDTLSNGTESLNDDTSVNEDDNHLEKIYMERFRSSPKSNRSSNSDHIYLDKPNLNENAKGFFINKSDSSRSSKSPKRSVSPYQNHSGTSLNRSKSPVSILSNKSNGNNGNRSPNLHHSSEYLLYHSNSIHSQNRSKSPLSISNQSSQNQRTKTVKHNDQYRDKLMVVSPEPSTSKTSLTKTTLHPTELRNPDGSKELRFPNGNIKHISADGKYSKFVYYNGDVKENFYNEGRIKYFYAETKTFHTTHADGLEVLEFPDGQVEKRYKDGSSEIRLPNGSVRYFDPKSEHVREEWRFPDGAAMTVSAAGEQRIVFSNGQIEVHAKDHKRREFPDGTVKLVYHDGTSETRYASGRVRIKDKHGNLLMDSATG